MAADIADQLDTLATLIEDSPHNLMSRRGLAELRSRHLPECAAFARALPPGSGRLVDIGSGGGLPGLVIGIVRPDWQLHLVESVQKKARFLQDASAALGLTVTVHSQRAEELARGTARSSFEVVTARAVAPIVDLIALAAPLLKPSGLLYAIKGDRWQEELDEATDALRRSNLQLVATPSDLPSKDPDMPKVVIFSRIRSESDVQ